MSDPTDRVRGVLYGLAAGDRIGGPIRMALRLAESLSERRAFDPADVMARYLSWWRAGGFDTGPVAEEVFSLITAGVPIDEAVRRVHSNRGGLTAGCNPAHRSPPLAMAAFVADEELADAARREALLTHFHRLAGEVAAEAAVLCRRLIRGMAWEEAAADSLHGGERALSAGGFAPEVLRAAAAFVDANDSFTDALAAAASFAGSANYCPVLAGAIAGARWGASAVPPALSEPEVARDVARLADALSAGWA
jgi:ADP-ribosylglycohydrolase